MTSHHNQDSPVQDMVADAESTQEKVQRAMELLQSSMEVPKIKISQSWCIEQLERAESEPNPGKQIVLYKDFVEKMNRKVRALERRHTQVKRQAARLTEATKEFQSLLDEHQDHSLGSHDLAILINNEDDPLRPHPTDAALDDIMQEDHKLIKQEQESSNRQALVPSVIVIDETESESEQQRPFQTIFSNRTQSKTSVPKRSRFTRAKPASHIEKREQTKQPRQLETTFEQVFYPGAELHEIIEFPEDSGLRYIIWCQEHNFYGGQRLRDGSLSEALMSGSTHLRLKHGAKGSFENVVLTMGLLVRGCTAEQEQLNNDNLHTSWAEPCCDTIPNPRKTNNSSSCSGTILDWITDESSPDGRSAVETGGNSYSRVETSDPVPLLSHHKMGAPTNNIPPLYLTPSLSTVSPARDVDELPANLADKTAKETDMRQSISSAPTMRDSIQSTSESGNDGATATTPQTPQRTRPYVKIHSFTTPQRETPTAVNHNPISPRSIGAHSPGSARPTARRTPTFSFNPINVPPRPNITPWRGWR